MPVGPVRVLVDDLNSNIRKTFAVRMPVDCSGILVGNSAESPVHVCEQTVSDDNGRYQDDVADIQICTCEILGACCRSW